MRNTGISRDAIKTHASSCESRERHQSNRRTRRAAGTLSRQHHAEPADLGSFLEQLRPEGLLFCVTTASSMMRGHFRFDEVLRTFF